MDFNIGMDIIPSNEIVIREVGFGLKGFTLLFEGTEDGINVTVGGLGESTVQESLEVVEIVMASLREEMDKNEREEDDDVEG